MIEQKQKPIQILMVDDNPGDVRLTLEAFKEWKVPNEPHVVSDGEEALRFLRQRDEYATAPRPDLIFLDLNMPKKSGAEVLEEIKIDPSLKRIPVIMMTTSSADDDVVKMYDLHVNSYVTKPAEIDELFRVVRELENYWFAIVTRPSH